MAMMAAFFSKNKKLKIPMNMQKNDKNKILNFAIRPADMQ
jgi:hypothetical protein